MRFAILQFFLILLILSAIVFFISSYTKTIAQTTTIPAATINVTFPCPSGELGVGGCPEMTTDSIPNYIVRLYQFGIGIAGILAVGMIIAGAIMYSISGAVDKKSEGKDMIISALWGVVLLFGSYLILKTINPDLINLKDPDAPQIELATTTIPTGAGLETCASEQMCAAIWGAPYPIRNSPKLEELLACIKQYIETPPPPHAKFTLKGNFTYDQSRPICNYTKGRPTAWSPEKCSHTINSCHYGGYSGKDGSAAVDYSHTGSQGQRIVNVANNECAAFKKSARCENSSGKTVDCGNATATHVHITAINCDRN